MMNVSNKSLVQERLKSMGGISLRFRSSTSRKITNESLEISETLLNLIISNYYIIYAMIIAINRRLRDYSMSQRCVSSN